MIQNDSLVSPSPSRPRGRGFAFTEVLFAVMVLGIGFIMIAAMFPVTIRQTQSSVEDTVAANVGKEAVAALQACRLLAQLPATGPTAETAAVADLRIAAPDVWREISGNLIHSQNPKYAWVPLYRRAQDAAQAQVFVIVMQVRNRTQYATGLDVAPFPGGSDATLQPKPVLVDLRHDDAVDTSEVTFKSVGGGPDYGVWSAGSGAFIVLAGGNTPALAQAAGHVYQLGGQTNKVNDTGRPKYELQPGADMVTSGENISDCPAYIIGRGFSLNQLQNGGSLSEASFEGAVQDIGIYTAFLRIDQ